MYEEVTISGDGLGILIDCQHIPIHHWMSFACWYSIRKFLSDAKVALACTRGPQTGMFGWAYRAKLNVIYHSTDVDITKIAESSFPDMSRIVISPYIMAAREFNRVMLGPVAAKDETIATLVNCEGGCGKFVVSKWIDSSRPPFRNAGHLLSSTEMTANEMKILQLWSDCYQLYTSLQ